MRAALAVFFAGFAATPLLSSACAPSSEIPGGSTSSATTGAGGQGGETLLPDAGDSGVDPDAACGLVTKQATSTPVDLYVTFDKSSSMAGDKWTSSGLGLGAFVDDPASAGIKIALNFFPLDNNPTCDQFAYQTPVVPFAPLPQNADPIKQAIAATTPNGFQTPIYPALGGAILGARAEANAHPGDSAAVLLVTDGQPQGPAPSCSGVNPEDPQAIADLAAAGVGYGVRTFVIGLPGVNQTIANQIAAAGGTDSAIVVGAGDVQAQFQAALAKVRGEALPCEYLLPDEVAGGEVDKGLVNVLYTPGGSDAAIVPQNADCSGPGWRYDDPASPTEILLCPETCAAVRSDLDATIQILLGCKTEIS